MSLDNLCRKYKVCPKSRRKKMNKNTSLQEIIHNLGPALKSKEQELHLYGYDTVTIEGLWDYLVHEKWDNSEEEIRLHVVVNDILSIKPGDFMNYTTRNEYKEAPLNLKLDDEELKLLLHGK